MFRIVAEGKAVGASAVGRAGVTEVGIELRYAFQCEDLMRTCNHHNTTMWNCANSQKGLRGRSESLN